jgi:hypothetical protein
MEVIIVTKIIPYAGYSVAGVYCYGTKHLLHNLVK